MDENKWNEARAWLSIARPASVAWPIFARDTPTSRSTVYAIEANSIIGQLLIVRKLAAIWTLDFFLLSDKKNYFQELSKKLENKVKKGKKNYRSLVRMERKNWWLLQLVFMCSESSSCDLWSPPTMFQGFCGEFAVRVERNASRWSSRVIKSLNFQSRCYVERHST